MTATTNTPVAADASAPVAEKKNPVIYTRNEQPGGHATLWIGKGLERSPVFAGLVNEVRVSLYKAAGPKGVFFNVAVSGAEGEQMKIIGTANVRVNPVGIPKLVIDIKEGKKTIWTDFRKEVTEDMLVSYGLDLAKRDAKKAEYEAKKAAAPAAEPVAA